VIRVREVGAAPLTVNGGAAKKDGSLYALQDARKRGFKRKEDYLSEMATKPN
jgi:hypothetical protein